MEADGRLVVADGERSWLDGGFGKTRFGGSEARNARFRARPVDADLVWQPHIAWSLDATVGVVAQQGQEQPVDLSQAYLAYRHDPIGRTRLAARMGLFWPPISLEHGGPAWSVTETITPSAINSWVGEEVKTVATEGTASLPLAGGHLALTAAAFGFNDTAGTLLAFRGWALHEEKATAFSLQPLPPLNGFMRFPQTSKTSPVIEIANRPGFYGRIGWSSKRATLAAFYYDNRGDPEARSRPVGTKQWGWRTRFGQLSAQLRPDERTTLSAQALTGTTQMGFPMNGTIWVDTSFRSAFLLATRRVDGGTSVSARAEAFATRARGSEQGPDSSEDGWAATLAAKHRLGGGFTGLAELLHIASDRPERARLGLDPRERQTVGQLSLRWTH